MAHDKETRTIDYTMDEPPEWATPEEKIEFWPKRTAKLICMEIERVEVQKATEGVFAKEEVKPE